MKQINPRSGHGMSFGLIGSLFMFVMLHPVWAGVIVAGIIAAIALAIYVFKHLRWSK